MELTRLKDLYQLMVLNVKAMHLKQGTALFLLSNKHNLSLEEANELEAYFEHRMEEARKFRADPDHVIDTSWGVQNG